MALYKLSGDAAVIQRTSDGAWIPDDPGNADWREYQAWLGAGNQPDPADQPPPPPLMPITHEQLVALLLQKGTLGKGDIDANVVKAAVAAQPDATKPIIAAAVAAVADAGDAVVKQL